MRNMHQIGKKAGFRQLIQICLESVVHHFLMMEDDRQDAKQGEP